MQDSDGDCDFDAPFSVCFLHLEVMDAGGLRFPPRLFVCATPVSVC